MKVNKKLLGVVVMTSLLASTMILGGCGEQGNKVNSTDGNVTSAQSEVQGQGETKTGFESTTLKNILNLSRPTEEAMYMDVVASSEDVGYEDILATMKLNKENIDTMALSASLMNVKAYTTAIIKPVDGKAEEVKKSLEDWKQTQMTNFEQYLADQYDVAQHAIITEANGYIIMAMCENPETFVENVESYLQKEANAIQIEAEAYNKVVEGLKEQENNQTEGTEPGGTVGNEENNGTIEITENDRIARDINEGHKVIEGAKLESQNRAESKAE